MSFKLNRTPGRVGRDAVDGVYLTYRVIREGSEVRVEVEARDGKPGHEPTTGSAEITLSSGNG